MRNLGIAFVVIGLAVSAPTMSPPFMLGAMVPGFILMFLGSFTDKKAKKRRRDEENPFADEDDGSNPFVGGS